MYHIPSRSRHINVNPWPQAIRRILIGIAILFSIAFLRSALEWIFDHTMGDGKLEFHVLSLAYLVPIAGIIAYLVYRKDHHETIDSGIGQLRMFAFNAFLATVAIYGLWDRFEFPGMFLPNEPEAVPYPYRGMILVGSTWLFITVTLQMVFTVIVMLKDLRTNVYDQDTEQY